MRLVEWRRRGHHVRFQPFARVLTRKRWRRSRHVHRQLLVTTSSGIGKQLQPLLRLEARLAIQPAIYGQVDHSRVELVRVECGVLLQLGEHRKERAPGTGKPARHRGDELACIGDELDDFQAQVPAGAQPLQVLACP